MEKIKIHRNSLLKHVQESWTFFLGYLYKQQLDYVVKYHMYMDEEKEYYQNISSFKTNLQTWNDYIKVLRGASLKLGKIILDLIWNNE